MTQVSFYHLTVTPLEKTLPKLLEKVLESGDRALVLAGSSERVEALSEQLWTYTPLGFLPHGTVKDGQPERQPIWLSVEDNNLNHAQVLILVDGASSTQIGTYKKCLDIFDGSDPERVTYARARWKAYKESGHELAYWQQNERGIWQKS